MKFINTWINNLFTGSPASKQQAEHDARARQQKEARRREADRQFALDLDAFFMH